MAVDPLKRAAVGELTRFVEEHARGFPAIEWVWRALRTRGKLLGPADGFCWGLLPPLACEAAGGDPRQALPVSVAIECAIAAADVLDDVQDQDSSDALWRHCGLATATNTATFLLFLSQLALVSLVDQGVPDGTVVEIVQEFASAGAKACSGQQLGFDPSSGSSVDEDQYLSAIAEKSASLARCACRSGALLGADALAAEPLSELGFNLGMAMQIGNDLAALTSEADDRADLGDRRSTMPIIFALSHTPEPDRAELADLLAACAGSAPCPNRVDRIREILAVSGAMLYTTVVSDVYWERALGCLERVDGGRARPLLDLLTRMRLAPRG